MDDNESEKVKEELIYKILQLDYTNKIYYENKILLNLYLKIKITKEIDVIKNFFYNI